MAAEFDLLYMEISNSTGEGMSRLFDVTLQDALNAKMDKEKLEREAEETAAEEAVEAARTVAYPSESKICTVL